MAKKKTKTGALPNSAGFPGKDMVNPIGSKAYNFTNLADYPVFKELGVKAITDTHIYWE